MNRLENSYPVVLDHAFSEYNICSQLADYESGLKIQRFKMADPIWLTKLSSKIVWFDALLSRKRFISTPLWSKKMVRFFTFDSSETFPQLERSFSTLRRLKTYLRNRTGEERLNGLALLNIHRDVEVTSDRILDILARKTRRIDITL